VASFLARFFGRTVSEGAAFAMGVAIGPALSPAVRVLVNEAWNKYPTMPVDAVLLAQGVSSGQVDRDWAVNEAQNTGISVERFARLIRIFDTGPGVEQAYRLWHRGILDEAGFRRACKREALEPEWIDALVAAKQTLLTPAELANARQQGYIQQARQYDEAEKWGVDNERAELQFLLSGLPPGPETGLEMLRRNIITDAEFGDLVREGHTKTKYTDELLALQRVLLSPGVLVELRLKGWIGLPEFHSRMALWGYSNADADDWYSSAGRPPTVRQAMVGFRRGARVAGFTESEDFYVQRAVAESNIRPEWAEVEHAANRTYPSAFVFRMLVGQGAITGAECADLLFESGWRRDLADKAGAAFVKAQTGGGASHVTKAETQLWTTQHASYKAGESDAGEVEVTLDLLGVPQTEHARILSLWNRERAIARKQLTPTQLKKAWKGAVTNPDTGAPWTEDEALARLESMGYSPEDAQTFLNE
jgi:hypothetical protein